MRCYDFFTVQWANRHNKCFWMSKWMNVRVVMKNRLRKDRHEPLSTIQPLFQCFSVSAHLTITWNLSKNSSGWASSTRSIKSEALGWEAGIGIFFNAGDSTVHQAENRCFNSLSWLLFYCPTVTIPKPLTLLGSNSIPNPLTPGRWLFFLFSVLAYPCSPSSLLFLFHENMCISELVHSLSSNLQLPMFAVTILCHWADRASAHSATGLGTPQRQVLFIFAVSLQRKVVCSPQGSANKRSA